MKKPVIIVITILTLFFAVFLGAVSSVQAGEGNIVSSCETRAVWLNPYAFDSSAKRNETLQKILDANLNTAFLLVPDDARYPVWSRVNDFEAMTDLLYSNGIEVHVWLINLHRVQGVNSDFTDPTEQEAQKDWAIDFLEDYDKLSGVHFDYIRYENQDRLHDDKIDGISQTIQTTQSAIDEYFPGKHLTAAVWNLGQDCADYRNGYDAGGDDIPAWFRAWFNSNIGNPLNRWDNLDYCLGQGYLDPYGVPTQMTVEQDSVTWVSNDYLDKIISMEYVYDTNWWSEEVDIWNEFLGTDISKVHMGLGWYQDIWNGAGVTPAEVADAIVDKITYGRNNGITGFSIFEFGESGTDDSILINRLSSSGGPYENEADSCLDCVPQCSNRDCGSDSCGGSCGSCGSGESCKGGKCLEVSEYYHSSFENVEKILNGQNNASLAEGKYIDKKNVKSLLYEHKDVEKIAYEEDVVSDKNVLSFKSDNGAVPSSEGYFEVDGKVEALEIVVILCVLLFLFWFIAGAMNPRGGYEPTKEL